jgi:hypothetical protein
VILDDTSVWCWGADLIGDLVAPDGATGDFFKPYPVKTCE